MESKVKILGHPVHQALIVFPLGLLSATVAFDALRLATRNKQWATASYRTLEGGLVGVMVAAPFGLIDWLAIPPHTRAKRVGFVHGLGNLIVGGLFGASWLLRRRNPTKRALVPFALEATGGAIATVTAWLGGELVNTLGVGVRPDANLDAASSLASDPVIDISIPGLREVARAAEPQPAAH
jgi:uncharacterized membrane protein